MHPASCSGASAATCSTSGSVQRAARMQAHDWAVRALEGASMPWTTGSPKEILKDSEVLCTRASSKRNTDADDIAESRTRPYHCLRCIRLGMHLQPASQFGRALARVKYAYACHAWVNSTVVCCQVTTLAHAYHDRSSGLDACNTIISR